MSDLSHVAICPGCGQRFAPDDGGCCVECERCGGWTHRAREVIEPHQLTRKMMRRDPDGAPRPRSLFVCERCERFNDTDAAKWYREKRDQYRFPDEIELLPGSTKVTR